MNLTTLIEEQKKEAHRQYREAYKDILSPEVLEIPNEWVNSLLTAAVTKGYELKEEEVKRNHFCCKFNTVNEEDFCDHCLATLQENKSK